MRALHPASIVRLSHRQALVAALMLVIIFKRIEIEYHAFALFPQLVVNQSADDGALG